MQGHECENGGEPVFFTSKFPGSQWWLGRFFRSSTSFTSFLSLSSRSENALSEIFGLEHVEVIYDDALKRYFELGKIEMAPENEIQKKWTEPTWFYDSNQRT